MKKIDFIKNRNRFYLITLAIALTSILCIFILKPNRGVEFSGAYQFTYQYETPLAEGAIAPTDDYSLITDLASEDPEVVELELTAVKSSLQNAGISYENLINEQSETYDGDSFLTIQILPKNLVEADPQATQDKLFETLTSAHSTANFSYSASTAIQPLFTRAFLAKVAVMTLVSFVVTILVLGFGLSDIGGIGISFVVAVSCFFTELVTMATFFLFQIKLGYNFIFVSIGAILFAAFITSATFKKLQNDFRRMTANNIEEAVNVTAMRSFTESLWVIILLAVIGVAVLVLILTKNMSISVNNLIPIIFSVLSAYYVANFFALPFWGTSIEFADQTKAKKKTAK